jgi:hypothetical protein
MFDLGRIVKDGGPEIFVLGTKLAPLFEEHCSREIVIYATPQHAVGSLVFAA